MEGRPRMSSGGRLVLQAPVKWREGLECPLVVIISDPAVETRMTSARSWS